MSIYTILPSFKTLRAKLLTVILPMMIFNFILFAFLYTIISYRNMYADQVAKIHEFTRIQSQVIAQPLWNMDYEFIHRHLDSMMLYPWVSQVILTEFNSGKIMERGESPQGLPDKDYVKTEEYIDITRNDLNFLIGRLTMISLTGSIYRSLLDTLKWVSLLGILLLVTMIISVMITHRIIIGRPLERFLLSIRKSDETEKREPVDWSSEDEIGRVIAAYNTLLINLDIGEKALKKSEKKYRLLVESMNEGLIIYDDSDRVSFANSRFCEIVEYPLEEIGNKDVSSLVSRESYKDTYQKLSEVRNGKRFSMESELIKKNGRKTPVILSVTPIFDEAEYKGTVCVITDISELKKVENKLRHAQKKYRDIFESVAEGIFRSTIDGRFLEVNPAMAAIFGFDTPGDMIRNISDIGKQLYENKADREDLLRSLKSKKSYFSQQRKMRRRDGDEIWVEITARLVDDENGNQLYIEGIASDITKRKLSEMDMQRKATLDDLTGIPNRFLFRDRMEHAINCAKRYNKMFALLYMDLDFFKHINDTIGHHAGDVVLRETALRIKSRIRKSDMVARIGGDEFSVILLSVKTRDKAASVAQCLIEEICRPINLKEGECTIGASIGISIYPEDGLTTDEIVRKADMAMFRSKKEGRNRYFFWDASGNANG